MDNPVEKTVEVLIASKRDDFRREAEIILRGYYPYKLHFVTDAEQILSPAESMIPLLALVDGHGGTAAASEWVQSVKMTYPRCPLIVLYGPEDQLEFSQVKKNGADYIMHIYHDREFVSDMILKLAPVELRGSQVPLSALMPVELCDLDGAEEINFDVLIYLPSNQKTFRVRKSGGKMDHRLIEKAGETHQRLYIKKTQLKGFFEYARTMLSMRNETTPVSRTEKIYKSKQLIYEIIAEFLNAEMADFQSGKLIFERCKQILAELDLTTTKTPEQLSKDIFRFTGHFQSTYQNCLSLAVFASSFAALLGMNSEQVASAAMAGLLHNVGLALMPSSTYGKNISEYTQEELKDYKIYPDRSVILIKSKKVPLPADVSTAIVQHQENSDGSGFPHGLDSSKMEPLGKVLRLAMRFQELTCYNGVDQGLTPRAALEAIKNEALGGKACVDLVTATQVFKKIS
jgi:HD-GYP domain-containing protein (c-di-GMP phosphodiesterase class II)